MQGMGVKAPKAAAVAAATAGLPRQLHMPKGATLATGAWSMMVAAGNAPASTPAGITFSTDGAAPKLHIRAEPVVTCRAMAIL
jgi:hypothetical protein